MVIATEFLSTPSARRATRRPCRGPCRPTGFLSTPSARRATGDERDTYYVQTISIHALREEGDAENRASIAEIWAFLSTPSARRATPRVFHRTAASKFLSTPSARRATFYEALSIQMAQFLSTPSARRATQSSSGGAAGGAISIHALREEGDANGNTIYDGVEVFLSTPSARRATPTL